MNRPMLPLATLALLLAVAAPVWAQRGDPSADFVTAQKSKGATAATVAAELQRTYREPADRIASLLIGAGYRPAPVLTTMVVDLRFPLASATADVGLWVVESEPNEAEEMAQTLFDADYSASDVAEVLVALYDADAEEVATVLKTVGYDVGEIAEALWSELGVDAAAAVHALLAAGYTCADSLRSLYSDENPSSGRYDQAEHLRNLEAGGCSRFQIRDAITEVMAFGHVAYWVTELILGPE